MDGRRRCQAQRWSTAGADRIIQARGAEATGRARNFSFRKPVRGADLVTFKNFSEFPPGTMLAMQAVFLDGSDDDLATSLPCGSRAFGRPAHALILADVHTTKSI